MVPCTILLWIQNTFTIVHELSKLSTHFNVIFLNVRFCFDFVRNCRAWLHFIHYQLIGLDLVCLSGPSWNQEEMETMAPWKISGSRHQIPAPVHGQQRQQLQHADLHVDSLQPQDSSCLCVSGRNVHHNLTYHLQWRGIVTPEWDCERPWRCSGTEIVLNFSYYI